MTQHFVKTRKQKKKKGKNHRWIDEYVVARPGMAGSPEPHVKRWSDPVHAVSRRNYSATDRKLTGY